MEAFLIITTLLGSILGFNPSQLIPTETLETLKETSSPPIELTPNEWNRIPILEYHRIGSTEKRWTRQYDHFRKDLEWLYNNDYVLLSIDDYAKSQFPIPKGKKPVILTFDDATINQFYIDENGTIDPNSAVGILDEFYKKYPSFGKAAAFYVKKNPFEQPEQVNKKLNYLVKTGRQVGYHTLNHQSLNGMNTTIANGFLKQQRKSLLNDLKPNEISNTLAYPHGAVPNGNLGMMKEFIEIGLLVGADPAYPLYHPRANAYRTPRIQAIDSEWLRHFGRKDQSTQRQINSENFRPFVSDGNPAITTPKQPLR